MRKRWLSITLLPTVIAVILAACGSSDKSQVQSPTSTIPDNINPSTYQTLDVQAAYTRYEQTSGAILVDVRTPEEWAATGVVPGARLIPLDQFEQRAPAELPKDSPIFVICNSGNRSRVASEALIRLGYSQVFNIDGGIQAWLRASLPVEPYAP
jgi:rhodanese-related sulfurtransferase